LKKYIPLLRKVNLFAGIEERELELLLECMEAEIQSYSAGEIIADHEGSLDKVGIVLNGAVQIQKEDINGNRNIISRVGSGEAFGEVFACLGVERIPVNIAADVNTSVMFIDFQRLIGTCPTTCAHHSRLIQNMLRLMAQRSLMLNEKLGCVGRRTTREKVEAFLVMQSEKAGSNAFEIPFTRAEMADYLFVDRSALSAVLSKMRNEGVIKFDKNRFEIVKHNVGEF
jgi:CRP-like cAMP-binding protein